MFTRRLFTRAAMAAPVVLASAGAAAQTATDRPPMVTIREHHCMGCCRRDTNPDAIIAAFNKMSPEERQRRTAGIRSALTMVGPR